MTVNCKTWTDCDGEENGNCFIGFEGMEQNPEELTAFDCDESMMNNRGGSDWNTEYNDIEGDKLILEMGSAKIVII